MTAQPDLIHQLQASTGDVARDALEHSEHLMPELMSLSGRDREAGLEIISYCVSLRLKVAAAGRDASAEEEDHLREYFRAAAERGIPVDTQLQITRRTIAFALHRYWQIAGPENTDAMLTFSAETTRFHHRLEHVLVDSYCARLGTAVVADRLRTAHAEALLNGDMPPPTGGARVPLSSSYLVMVIPGGAGTPPPLGVLSGDERVLHTVRERADVVLIPAEPGGRAIADSLAARALTAGRVTAVAVPPAAGTDVPSAYAQAVELLAIAPALRRPPAVITPAEALPERLLRSDPEAAGQLSDLVALLASSPGLVETLTAFLDSDLDRSATAETLHIHRRTLTQRLHRIRELTGYDPRSSRGVQIFSLAVAARTLGRLP